MKDPNRRFLLTTPGGLGALNRALPRSTQVDPQAALLLDQAFLDFNALQNRQVSALQK